MDFTMTPYPEIDWSQTMGGNDEEGDCGPVALANLMNLWYGPPLVERTEVERLYTIASGWTSENPGSDRGVILETLIRDWCANGWPADPTVKPAGYEAVSTDQAALMTGVRRYGALVAAVMLPADQDFSDDALSEPGTFGHAVLVVAADPDGVRLVTWASVRRVSWRWWGRFGRQAFGVERPDPDL